MINAVMLSYTKDAELYEMTKAAIKSLRAAKPEGLYLVVVETNQNLWNEPWFKEHYECDTITFEPNFSFNRSLARGRNIIPTKAGSDYFCAFNNDLLFYPGCFERMIEQLKPKGRYDCVSAKSQPTEVQRGFTGVVEGYQAGRTFSGWAWMCCESMFSETPFEVFFPPKFAFWYQDNYFIDVMLLKGKRHALVCDARIDHLESRSHRLLENAHELTHGQERIYRGNHAP